MTFYSRLLSIVSTSSSSPSLDDRDGAEKTKDRLPLYQQNGSSTPSSATTSSPRTRRIRRNAALAISSVILFLLFLHIQTSPDDSRSGHGSSDRLNARVVKQQQQQKLLANSLLSTNPTSIADTFADYNQSPECHLTSHELYLPTLGQPSCSTKGELMAAMSSGGRLGFDAPYQSRGCNMPFLSTAQICAALSKYSQVHIIGDSLMREMTSALFPFLRQDLINGPHADWADRGQPEQPDCGCSSIFEERRGECGWHVLIGSEAVYENAPESMSCPHGDTAEVIFHYLTSHPIPPEHLASLTTHLSPFSATKPAKPIAFVFGQGLWNELDVPSTYAWIDEIDSAIYAALPWLEDNHVLFPRLFITPSAAQRDKPDAYIQTQGNVALMRFEKSIEKWCGDTRQWFGGRGIDFLGTYNMSVQTTSPDGTHSGWRLNLLKAQMVFNWLDAMDTLSF